MAAATTADAWDRRGFSYRGLILALVLVAAVPAIAWSVWPKLSFTAKKNGPMLHQAARGEFVHVITDRGNVESANNVEIRCEVKSKGSGGSTILEIVPEGTNVQRGDVLVKLDSSALENERVNQQIVCNNSEATAIQARNVYETALIAKREYTEGTYQRDVQMIESEVFVAEENLRRAEEYLQYSERLAARGYIPALQLEADRFAVEKARKDLESAKTKLDVLQQFTKEKMGKQLESDIRTAEAKLKAAEASHQLDIDQLAFVEEQIAKCVIRAPEEGQVVYANVIGYRGTKEVMIDAGETVRERQVIIRLPDPKRMQVAAKVNEAKVALVAVGMPATVRLDAFPDMELKGTVEKVNEFPLPTSMFGSNVKEYETIVRIHEPKSGLPPGLRPGLTAEVHILVERRPGVLQVPVQAIFEHGGKCYCVTGEDGKWSATEVEIGSSNDKFVVISSGLEEGRQIVLNAAAFRDEVDLPEVPRDSGRVGSAARGEAVAPPSEPVAGRPAGSAPPRGDDPAAMVDGMIKQFDANKDGKLQIDELPEGMRSRMQQADANGDGAIDGGELRTAFQRFMPRGGGAGGPPPGGAP